MLNLFTRLGLGLALIFGTTSSATALDLAADPAHAPSPAGTPWPSDLRPDPNFGSIDGTTRPGAPAVAGFLPHQEAVRLFPWYTPMHGLSGYYVFGRHKHETTGWGAWIMRVHIHGVVDTDFGNNGWMFMPGTARSINDAALANDRLYVLRTINSGGNRSQIQCWSLLSNSDCFPSGPVMLSFTTGSSVYSIGRRILHDERYGLLVAAELQNSFGTFVGIARRNASTGASINAFGTLGFVSATPPWSSSPATRSDVFDIALAPAGTPGGDDRLYLVGKARDKIAPFKDDGFIHGIDPVSGNTLSGWNWQPVAYEDDNPTAKGDDALTTLTVQRNGRVLAAGWSINESTGFKDLILSRFLPNGLPDPAFCNGTVCNNSASYNFMTHPKDNVPVGIAERTLNGDIVVLHTDRYPSEPEYQFQMQKLSQFGASGKFFQGQNEFLHAGSMDYVSEPTALWVGQLGALGYGPEVVATVGFRSFNPTQVRAAVAQRISTDNPNTIFVTGFGQQNND